MSYDFTRLPKPSREGHYWWGIPGGEGPAIFRITSIKPFVGFYMLSLGRKGILFEGRELCTFATPDKALEVLRSKWREKVA